MKKYKSMQNVKKLQKAIKERENLSSQPMIKTRNFKKIKLKK